MYNRPNQMLTLLLLRYNFYQWKSKKHLYTTNLTSYWHNCFCIIILQAEKRKYQVYATGLTSYWHYYPCFTIFTSEKVKTLGRCNQPDQLLVLLHLHYNFCEQKSEKQIHKTSLINCCYICPYIIIFTSKKTKTHMCNLTSYWYSCSYSALRFLLVEK